MKLEFRKKLQLDASEFANHFEMIQNEEITKIKKIIKYENDYDFWCGWMIGHFEAYHIGLLEGKSGRVPNQMERDEIRSIVESDFKIMQEKLAARFKKHSS